MNLINNARWVAISQLFKIAVQLINLIVLTRLIPPTDYGVMAMALVVTNLGLLVRDLGTSAALIQRKVIDDGIINAVFWLNLIMGFSITIIIVISAPFVAVFFEQPKLLLVLILLSMIFPISSSASAHLALLERSSKFKKIAGIEISSSLISVIIAIIAAYYGLGIFSLVVQALLINSISSVCYWKVSAWRPNIKKIFCFRELKKIIGFSGNLFIFNFINYFSRNADSLIVGHYMSTSILGAYNLAYRIMLFPLQSLTFIVNRSLFPILSRQQDNDEQLRESYFNCIFLILFIVVPLMSGLAILREPFVSLVFGKQWSLTANILLWLAPTAIVQSILSTSGTVFMAKGKTGQLMILGIVGMILQVGAFLFGVRYDIVFFAKCYFIANVINFIPVMFLKLRILHLSFIDLFKKIYLIFVSAVIMIATIYSLQKFDFFLAANLTFISLIQLSIIGGFVYVASSFILIKTFRTFTITLYKKFIN